MSCSNYDTYKPGNCPNCGKDGGAYMSSSVWGHSFACCSDKCGIEIKEKLEKNESSKEYEKLQNKLWELKEKLHDCRYEGIDGSEPFFDF